MSDGAAAATIQSRGCDVSEKLCVHRSDYRSLPLMEDPFQPTWLRALFAVAVAGIGFLLPQEVPLEYYPLNAPSSGLRYLEITCAADANGMVEIFMDTGRGFNAIETIQWPISPGKTPFTYTFPLADAPLVGLRLAPFENGAGELGITNFRIINRREQELRHFSKDDFQLSHQIAAVTPTVGGWKLVTAPDATHPYSDIRLGSPLIAEGMGRRNLQRCLLSWSYLSVMIWVLLMAVYSGLRSFTGIRGMLRGCAFLLLLAVLFSAVGNRGLIRNSVRYSEYGTAGGG